MHLRLEGGKRTKHPSNNNGIFPLISIITVVYNSEQFLERTILSVINQTYENIEYIIVDGGSKDKTLEIIQKYDEQIDYWLSEKDKGLYDAMNKGLHLATGDYLWFINSGDQINGSDLVAKIFFKSISSDVYFGEAIIVDESDKEIGLRRLSTPENLTWKSLQNGMCVSHQALIVKKSISSDYNLSYRFSADFDWVINALKRADKITNTKLVLIRYLDGGLTKSNILKGLLERFRIMLKNYGFFTTLKNHVVLGFRFVFYVIKNRRF